MVMLSRPGQWALLLHTLIGAILGVVVLHPVTTLVFSYEFGPDAGASDSSPIFFLLGRLKSAFEFEMIPMSLVFAGIGGTIGLCFGAYHARLFRARRALRYLEHELKVELPMLIDRGEGEQLEFKSSFRWDRRKQRVNRDLQHVAIKAIAGFLNHQGGNLLIGVEDDGTIAGIDADVATLKHSNRDGFERLVMDAAREHLGGNACALIHCRYHEAAGQTVCRVIVEKSLEPIYFSYGGTAHFMMRAGNSTRELDVREAHAHLQQRGLVRT